MKEDALKSNDFTSPVLRKLHFAVVEVVSPLFFASMPNVGLVLSLGSYLEANAIVVLLARLPSLMSLQIFN